VFGVLSTTVSSPSVAVGSPGERLEGVKYEVSRIFYDTPSLRPIRVGHQRPIISRKRDTPALSQRQNARNKEYPSQHRRQECRLHHDYDLRRLLR
jgi:hypothetical protein